MTENIEIISPITDENPRSNTWIWVVSCLLLFVICCCCLTIIVGFAAIARFFWYYGDQIFGIESAAITLLG